VVSEGATSCGIHIAKGNKKGKGKREKTKTNMNMEMTLTRCSSVNSGCGIQNSSFEAELLQRQEMQQQHSRSMSFVQTKLTKNGSCVSALQRPEDCAACWL
ncbi:Hypothetical predicted protein, partial [Drosophila guanche]